MRGLNSPLVNVFFPRCCVSCAKEGALLCVVCAADLSLDGPPFAYANPVIRKLICAWKYDGDQEGLSILRDLLRSRIEPLRVYTRGKNVLGIVPIPLSSWKERWRGFSQVRELARVVGDLLEIPVIDVLERKYGFVAQANLPRKERKKALKKNPVSLRRGGEVPNAVVLLDDVETTGATMSAAEEVVRAAGAEVVVRWSLAKG